MNVELSTWQKLIGDFQGDKGGDDNLACMKKIPVNFVMKYVFELPEAYGEPAKKIPRVYGAYECRVIDLAKVNR